METASTDPTADGGHATPYDLGILILAPTSNDAQLTARFLADAGLTSSICKDMHELEERMGQGCGAMLLAEEALGKESRARLATMLGGQPSWSELPLILITASGVADRYGPRHLSTLGEVGNISIIERPVRPSTLLSTCEVALRSRRRQYQVRDLLREMEELVNRRRLSEEALREADRRKDEFLAMLAHELRNPLAAVTNAAALLGSRDMAEREWAEQVIKRQSRQLSHLIDDLLDVSRITTGKIHLRKEIVDAAIPLDRAIESAQPLLRAKGHTVVRDYRAEVLWIEGDSTRLEQIFLNLVTNAAKYTPAGGLIQVHGRKVEGEVLVTLQDDGIGMSATLLPQIFDLFAQGERSIARSEGGLGIGLTIVHRLVEMHGGAIMAHSDGPHLGSTFSVRFPSVSPPARSAPSNTKATGGSALRVLIVDDNRDTAQGMARLLTRVGHDVQLAHDGAQALDMAREQKPQAVVLDIGLPGMDGFEVARHMRREAWSKDATIIAVTGYGQPEDRQQALEAGCNHHLVKPVDIKMLQDLLSTHRVSPQT